MPNFIFLFSHFVYFTEDGNLFSSCLLAFVFVLKTCLNQALEDTSLKNIVFLAIST